MRLDEIGRTGGHLLQTSLVPDKDPEITETFQARDLHTFHAAYSAAQYEAERGEIVLDMSSLPRRREGVTTRAKVRIFWTLKNPVAGVYFGGERPSFSASIQEGDTVEAKCSEWDTFKEGKVTRVNGSGPFTYDVQFEDLANSRAQGIVERGLERHQMRKYSPAHVFTFRRPLAGGVVLGGGDAARSCFPCRDALDERCPWDIIIECAAGLTAVASGKLVERKDERAKGVPAGMQRWKFRCSEAVPAHAIGFAVGQFLRVDASPSSEWTGRYKVIVLSCPRRSRRS